MVQAPRSSPPTNVAEGVKQASWSSNDAEDALAASNKGMSAPPIFSKEKKSLTDSSRADTAQRETEKPEMEPRRQKMSEPQLSAGDTLASDSTQAEPVQGDSADLPSDSVAIPTNGEGIDVVLGGDPDSNNGTPSSSATASASEAS